uniref:Defensin beta 29 n=1 Tax=Nannospalax galili TaxID=1026970 RepID=A0A8C6W7P7_NANGA
IPIMRPYFMTITVLLILVEKTPGGLFGFPSSKRQVPWVPCELYQGICRNADGTREIQYLTRPNNQKRCLKFPVASF